MAKTALGIRELKKREENRRVYLENRAKEKSKKADREEGRRLQKIKNKIEPYNYRVYKGRAQDKGIEFSISVEQFNKIISEYCTYCGGPGGGMDKVNCKLGYTMENSVPCCGKCNKMKFTHSVSDFIIHIRKIAEWQDAHVNKLFKNV